MKQIFIHAGHGKTGSSAIQKFLSQNHRLLKSRGIWYPLHKLEATGVSSGNYKTLLSRDNRGALKISPAKVQSLRQEFEKHPARVLLLSSEAFFIHLKELATAIPEARFIVYLRDPLSYAESSYNQSVKRGNETQILRIGEKPSLGIIHHLDTVLKTIERKRIVLRYFHPSFLQEGGDALGDFLKTLNIDIQVNGTSRVNTSYSFEALELKRLLNEFPIHPYGQYLLDKSLQTYGEGTTGYSLIPPNGYQKHLYTVLEGLKKFFARHPFPGSEEYLTALAKTDQKKYCPQPAPPELLAPVVAFLQQVNPGLFQHLVSVIKNHPQPINASGAGELMLSHHKPEGPLGVFYKMRFVLGAFLHRK